MFSRTTIAASTIIPTAKAIPASDMTFSVRPVTAIATKVATIDTGIAMLITSVARGLRRKINSTVAAKRPPIQMFWVTRSIAPSI